MQFFQHVYGRVAKGYQSRYQGYQLAALSDELTGHSELLENLNRFSFFNFQEGKGTESRYSFYRPMDGYLAFGCSRFARDRTGSIGSFAHHFICEEKEFIESFVSPVDILKSLTFLQNESELPSTRSLPILEFHPSKQEIPSKEWQTLAFQLLDMYMGKIGPVVPMVVASETDTWNILGELFSILPRLETSRLSFSTLFTEATAFVEAFRLVFVPDIKYVPTGTYIYRVIVPNETPITLIKSVAFTSFWRKHPEQAPSLLKLIHVLRHVPEKIDEVTALFPNLLSLGQLFRDCVESLQIPKLFNLILRDAKWIADYWQAGAPLTYDCLAPILWECPESYLIPLLRAVAQLHQLGLRDLVIKNLACQVSIGQANIQLIEALQSTGDLQRFYEIASENLDSPDLCNLATKLRLQNKTFYDNQLHYTVAQRILTRIAADYKRRDIKSEQWLQDETNVRPKPFSQAVVDLIFWVNKEGNFDFQLGSYRIGKQQYINILKTAWPVGWRFLSASDLIRTVFHTDYRNEFFSFFASELRSFNFSSQKKLLQAIASISKPHGAENKHLVEAIGLMENSSDLAEYYRELLSKLYPLDERAILQLKSIEQKSRWRGWKF